MDNKLILYHGSQQIVRTPQYGKGKKYNDYGLGFYCTESAELAKEWACPIPNDGYANRYELDLQGLNVMKLTSENYNILNWLAILLKNRTFDITARLARQAKEYLLDNFLPNTNGVDVIVGYRADDSYFSFAEDFINGTISVRDLSEAMRLGKLGEQIVLVSPKAFDNICFVDYEIADCKEYFYKRDTRDKQARSEYKNKKANLAALKDDLFVIDIIREEIKNGDPRL